MSLEKTISVGALLVALTLAPAWAQKAAARAQPEMQREQRQEQRREQRQEQKREQRQEQKNELRSDQAGGAADRPGPEQGAWLERFPRRPLAPQQRALASEPP